jgi:hypothetical protein|tara:strand:+ start:818 stop:1030 length:213 start_codon:yes stop_codon:yes gene_type:complete
MTDAEKVQALLIDIQRDVAQIAKDIAEIQMEVAAQTRLLAETFSLLRVTCIVVAPIIWATIIVAIFLVSQ